MTYRVDEHQNRLIRCFVKFDTPIAEARGILGFSTFGFIMPSSGLCQFSLCHGHVAHASPQYVHGSVIICITRIFGTFEGASASFAYLSADVADIP